MDASGVNWVYRESHFIFRMSEFRRKRQARWIVKQKEDFWPNVCSGMILRWPDSKRVLVPC